MQLESRNVAHYLLARSGDERRRVMSGDFMVVDAGRRNKNFKVLHGDGSGLFVKQVRDDSPSARATLEREAAFYRALAERPALARLAALCPRFVAWDGRAHVLTVELVAGGRSLQELQAERGELSVDWARAVGGALATLHAGAASLLAEGGLTELPALPRLTPWVLSLTDWNAAAPGLTRAHAQLVAQVQSTPTLAQALWRLRREWQQGGLVHGDMKWDNVVLLGAEPAAPDVRLVDWELVDLGDPAWDMAGLLQSFVVHWLGRFPELAQRSLEALCAADPALPRLHAATRALQAAYRDQTDALLGLDARGQGSTFRAFMERATRSMAARLLQTVYELEATSPQLSPRGACVVALCGAISSRPDVALDALLGGTP
jgi:Ser/Thr protein kinase RdoA (MazF antagonist)